MSTTGDRVEETSPSPRRPRLIFLVIGLVTAAVLAAVLSVVASRATSSGGGTSQLSGYKKAPHFTLPALGSSRKEVGLPKDGGGDGRPAILLFFASWCPPCTKEIPALAATYRHQQRHHSDLTKVAVIGVDDNDPTSNALAFVRSSGITFPVAADVDMKVTQTLFDFDALPESVFVLGNGTIAAIHIGGLSTHTFVSWEDKLLATT